MAHGIEGPLRTADSRMIRQEERHISDPESLIESEAEKAQRIVTNSKLMAVLQGEEYFRLIQKETDSARRLKLALGILKSIPFIIKLLPPEITEDNHQAALIVGIANAIQEDQATLH
jgi:hypothetical protein